MDIRKARRALIVACLPLLLLAAPVTAHEQAGFDTADSEGPLDISYARVKHVRSGDAHFVRARLSTYESWDPSLLSGAKTWVAFEFDTDDGAFAERRIFVTYDDEGGLGAQLYGSGWGEPTFWGSPKLKARIKVKRADDHGVTIVFKRRILDTRRNRYEWVANTSFQQEGEPCPTPEPHGDGGFGTCSDFTNSRSHG